jgi:hypothetical protein
MIDVKKLITGFLILATAAVCSGLIFSLTSVAPNVATVATPQVTIGEIGNGAGMNNNAFLPTEDQVAEATAILAPDLASSTMTVTSTDPTNLTDALASQFVNGVVSANPSGPSGVDADGNPVLTDPDINAIAAAVAGTSATKDLSIPNWDTEAAAIPVAVTPSSPAALTNYGTDVDNTLNSHVNAQVQSIISSTTDSATPSDLSYVQSQIQNTLQDVASLKVPAPAVAYHKSLLAELVYQKNMAQLSALAQTDPVKASIIFQEEQQKFSAVQQNLLTQAQDLASKSLSLQEPVQHSRGNMLLSFINNTFEVPHAQAQWPVFDPATWSLIEANQLEDIGDQLEGILKNTLLQILKNTLIALVQSKVLKWVQGSGAPRFITNWGTQMVNAAQQSALNQINSQITSGCNVYSGFAPQISVNLKSLYVPATNSACANQFAAALGANSFQKFYSDFSSGGFIAYGASTLPSGNISASQFFQAQKTDLAYRNQQAATVAQTQTSQGFTGDAMCDDHSNPKGTSQTCEMDGGGEYVVPAGGQCAAGDKLVTVPNNGLCADGSQPIVQTPSAVTGFNLDTAGQGTTQEIAAANDIIGLLNSVLSSLVLGLANAAVTAAGQVVNQTLTSQSPSGISAGAASTPAPTAPQLACNPTSQTIFAMSATSTVGSSTIVVPTSTIPASVTAAGGTPDANGNIPTYSWSASNGTSGSGPLFSDAFATPGTYTITLTDSTNDAPATCTVVQQ